MEAALLNLLDRVVMLYDELYGQAEEEEAVDHGYARGIYHASLEGLRAGIRVGNEGAIQLGLPGAPAYGPSPLMSP